MENEKASNGDYTVSIMGLLIMLKTNYSSVLKLSTGILTAVSGKPNAEPRINPIRANQPTDSCVFLGSLFQGLCTRGTQTDSIGSVTTEFGMNRKAMILATLALNNRSSFLRLHT